MENFNTDNWIALAAIIIPIILMMISNVRNWIFILFKKIKNRKIEVISPSLDEKFSSLNSQMKATSFLSKNGYITIDSILQNHYSLFQTTLENAGQLRKNEVYIKCYKNNSQDGGTIVNIQKEEITNLLSSTEIHITLKDIVSDWNKKVNKVKSYSNKEKIEFVSRFHLYFEMIHPFLDGNGRIGRMIINEQLSFLFDKIIDFKPESKKYYEAISLAVKGDESLLKLIIQEEVQKQ